MIILEKPFVSNELKNYLAGTQTALLDNNFARQNLAGTSVNFIDENTARERIAAGERVYTISENALDWVCKNTSDKNCLRVIETMKNKAAMRELLKSVYPNFFFKSVPASELGKIDFSTLPVPVILKPTVGFFSVGVYTIQNENDWQNALADIEKTSANWRELYPENVLGNNDFIIEKYICGNEYAVDVYFDDCGNAVVLNILKHDFASASDVSDRLYYTSAEILRERLAEFTDFFNKINSKLGARNFPTHVELRVENGEIIPIEFNPMRFAGWCCTDVAFFAFGVRTYDYFLNNKKPDWEQLLAGKENKIYTMIVLNKPVPEPKFNDFNYDALCAKFEKVLCLRKMNWRERSIFGFLYTETQNPRELEFIVNSDLTEFCE